MKENQLSNKTQGDVEEQDELDNLDLISNDKKEESIPDKDHPPPNPRLSKHRMLFLAGGMMLCLLYLKITLNYICLGLKSADWALSPQPTRGL
jgi:hypothetical protein